MKKSITIYALCCAGLTILSPAFADETSSVRVTFTGLPSTDGVLFASLCDEAGYPERDCHNSRITLGADTVTHEWMDIPKGLFGVTALHDENNNGRMDFKFYGPPAEAWGASNNPPPRMGPPRWRDIEFELQDGPVELVINMRR